jgi:hypothetical protein
MGVRPKSENSLSGKTPPNSKERKESFSALDFQDMKKAIEELQTQSKKTDEMVTGMLKGFGEKVIPMLDAHEQVLSGLPGQLESSFSKQTELLKGYIENRLKPAIDTTTSGSTTTTTTKGSGWDVKKLIDWGMEEIEKAGGIRNLLGGNQGGGLNGEIINLEKEMLARQRLVWRDSLRKALGLPTEITTSGPVVVKAP